MGLGAYGIVPPILNLVAIREILGLVTSVSTLNVAREVVYY